MKSIKQNLTNYECCYFEKIKICSESYYLVLFIFKKNILKKFLIELKKRKKRNEIMINLILWKLCLVRFTLSHLFQLISVMIVKVQPWIKYKSISTFKTIQSCHKVHAMNNSPNFSFKKSNHDLFFKKKLKKWKMA